MCEPRLSSALLSQVGLDRPEPAPAAQDRLHDTLVLSLCREAQPLPPSVEPGRVRALRRSQLVELVGEVLRDQVAAWEGRIAEARDELELARRERQDLETRLWVKDTELSRLEELQRVGLERVRARAARLDALEAALAGLEAAEPGAVSALQRRLVAAQTEAKQAARRASKLTRERAALRAALAEGRAQGARLERVNERLQARLAESEARARVPSAAPGEDASELRRELERAQQVLAWRTAANRRSLERCAQEREGWERRQAELSRALAARDARLAEGEAQAAALRSERETLNAPLSSAGDAITALREQLQAARKVQRLSLRLGTLTAPRGAEELRRQRPDYPLFVLLGEAERELRSCYVEADRLERELEEIARATRGRAAGAAWVDKELFTVRRELEQARQRSQELDRSRWSAEEALEARTAELTQVERERAGLQDALAECRAALEAARHQLVERAALQRELDEACREADTSQQDARTARLQLASARLRAEELARERAQVTGEAIQALAQADAERRSLTEQLRREEALRRSRERVGRQLARKIKVLQRALHRDQGEVEPRRA